MTLFNGMTQEKLTPNQFYLLYCMKTGLSPTDINIHVELRELINSEWVNKVVDEYVLTPKSIAIVNKIESYFTTQHKKSNNALMGEGFEENAQKYNDLFPKRKLGSGKPARSHIKNIVTAFKWFFENYDYSWDVILHATELYLEKEEETGYKYTRTSQYFIKKQDVSDKSINSELANFCQLSIDGEEFEKPQFTEKVF